MKKRILRTRSVRGMVNAKRRGERVQSEMTEEE